ncbi:MAG TPA: type II toxin-antitoxin system RelE/ParE family toxin [Thermomonas sp.]|nr:type II toxin-antitoxin system RelE/ParE family toxin [Thermomonas sp.]
MIRSFGDEETRKLFETGRSKRFSGFAGIAMRKLAQLDAAHTLDFLRAPPGNRLEALKGDRKGQCSIRINDQFRICFRWTPDGPERVEIVDYH